MVFGSGAFGRRLGHEGGALMMELVALQEEELACFSPAM